MGLGGHFGDAPPALPLSMDVERLAIAMAAAQGISWLAAGADTRASFRVSANGGLIWLASTERVRPARHLAGRLDGIVAAVRHAADVMDLSRNLGHFRESDIQEMFAYATEAEVISRVLRGAPEMEPHASADGLDGLEDEVGEAV